MPKTTAEQMRQWDGLAVLSFGFRPFFLLGALWAAFAMAMWISMLAGGLVLPTRFDIVSWHAHEFLFGYLSAIIAGFLLTAVPNWTGRLPVLGWRLGALVALWISGRLAIAFSAFIPAFLVALVDVMFAIALGLLIAREIVAGKNWRNLIVLAMLTVFTLANLLFHMEAGQGTYAAQGIGLRLGLAAVLMMISVIGGRIVPSFTRNWLVKSGHDTRPVPPMQAFDKVVLMITLAGLALWVLRPDWPVTGLLLLLLATFQTVRLVRWKGLNTLSEPLVWVLHLGYGLVPLGALFVGIDILLPGVLGLAAPQHVWMTGATGLMTLAVMTRATLGHTGQALHAGSATLAIYLALIASVSVRLAAGLLPDIAMVLYSLSALLWMGAFAGFVIAYGGLLLRPKPGMSS
ncbi:MAG: NnrS family protein [Rhizobiaceae bacterium]|nr:NnrS family protein [Rhizobiaceae bacterium]